MQIIVMGGAGDMGSRAVEDLASAPDVDLVLIADKDADAGKKLASRLRGAAADVRFVPADADDHAGLVKAMRGCDVVASALGPFHRFEEKLVAAAIEAGVPYASICDEWDAAERVFARFDGPAKEKGIPVLLCLGASPGATSVGFRHLAARMDRVRKADIYCYQPLDAGGGEAVFKHMLHIISGEIAVWRGGRRVVLPALSEERLIEFPKFGKIKLWNMGHAEPMTIPRFFPDIEEVNFFMGFGRGSGFFIHPARWGAFATAARVDRGAKLMAFLEGLTSSGKEPAWGSLRIDVFGEKDGKAVSESVCGIGQMRDVTGLSLSIGTLMLARRELTVTGGGVFAPEACLQTGAFIETFKTKGLEVYEDLGMTKPLRLLAETA